jgi:hypothetical protein
MLIQCGDAEVLRDEGTLFAHKASLAGVDVHHEVYADCPHVFQAFIFLEASRRALQNARVFVRDVVLAHREPASMDPTSIDRELLSDAHAVKDDAELEPATLPSEDPATHVAHAPHPHGVPPNGGAADDLLTETEASASASSIGSFSSKDSKDRPISEDQEEATSPSSPTAASKRTRQRARSFLEACARVASSSSAQHQRSVSQPQLPADVSDRATAEEVDADGSDMVLPRQRHDRRRPSRWNSGQPNSPTSSGRPQLIPRALQMSAAVSDSPPSDSFPGDAGGAGDGDDGISGRRHKRSSTTQSILRPETPHRVGVRMRSSSHPELRAMLADYDARGQHQATTIYRSFEAGEHGEHAGSPTYPGAVRSSESEDDEDPYLEFSSTAHHHNDDEPEDNEKYNPPHRQ